MRALILSVLVLLTTFQSGVCDELRPDQENELTTVEPVPPQASRTDWPPRNVCRMGEWFKRYPGNPLDIPVYGAWGVVHPDMMYFPNNSDRHKFWMYYTPYPPSTLELPCLVWSEDGINFDGNGIANPLIPGNAAWESGYLGDPDVIKVGDQWYMYYLGVREIKPRVRVGCIGVALSHNGINWMEYENNPILTPAFYWEYGWVGSPSVYHDGEKFWMWFAGGYTEGIELASSLDGIHFTRENGGVPVLPKGPDAWDSCGVSHPDVLMYRDTLWMFYWGYNDCKYYCLGLAKSVDKFNWTKSQYNPVLDTIQNGWEGLHIYRSSPLIINDTMWLYYSAFTDLAYSITKIGLAKSYDIVSGDANGSGEVDISDAVYMIAYIFSSGPPAAPLEAGDADNSGALDVSDVVYLINFIFGGGPAPCTSC